MITIDDLFAEDNLKEAMESFANKRDTCGVDGVKLSDLGSYWQANGIKIKEAILNGTYKMGVVEQKEIINYKGKRRTISLMNSIDRFIYRALYQILTEIWEARLSDCAFAYRKNKGITDAVEMAAAYLEQGKTWSVEIDIRNFFDNIDHMRMMEKLKKEICDPNILELILAYLKCETVNDHVFQQMDKGILQGGPLSPLLSNIYMNELDHYMEEKGYSFCRFGDDINIYCESFERGQEIFLNVSTYIKECEKLSLNENKTGIFKGINRKYLGCRFECQNGHVIVRKEKKAYRTVYRDWHTTGIQRVDRNYHLINEGILTKKDFTILFEGEDGKKYIPVETTDALYIYSNVILTGNFFEYINKVGVNICIIDKFGEKIGTFVPQNNRRNIKTELKQLHVYDSEKERTELARSLEIASVSNIRANIRYYGRRKGAEELDRLVLELNSLIAKINEAKDITQMMMYEAQARQKYYQAFNVILAGSEFHFAKRTRRPPLDPLNAMISFGNTLLYQRIANEINRTSLDIRIGIVHAAGSRPESLNLDLADLFKPILVDRTIFTVVNRRMLRPSDFIEVENDGIYLNKEAKRIFISEFEHKIYQKVKIEGIERTYDFAIKNEVQKLKKAIENGTNYKPYKYT